MWGKIGHTAEADSVAFWVPEGNFGFEIARDLKGYVNEN